ncbi:hypothetical protein [Vibrio phage VCPH]|nr:hypothetical protein [Vibrio phage VCPH]
MIIRVITPEHGYALMATEDQNILLPDDTIVGLELEAHFEPLITGLKVFHVTEAELSKHGITLGEMDRPDFTWTFDETEVEIVE